MVEIRLIQTFFEVLNAGLLIAILIIFVQNYRRMKTSFGLGLILFAAVLLLRSVLGVFRLGLIRDGGRGVFLLVETVPEIAMFGALVVLLYLVTK